MSNQITDKATEYLGYQLSVIPTKEDKTPTIAWTPYQSNRMSPEEVEGYFSKAPVKGIAVICGAVSGGLEVIDVDTKHDTTGSLWDELSSIIQGNLPQVYKSLVIAQTKSGGYHLYYRCSSIAGNLKLATKQNREVLIETRGQGGYVVAPPSPGYSYIQGEPGNIPTITPEERDSLLSIAKSFNELPEVEPKVSTPTPVTPSSSGLSPFEDYKERGDLVDFLEDKGWKVVRRTGQRIYLLRPGDTKSAYSGNFHTELRTLRIFSSSTEFNPDIAYNPSQVFSLLECSGDNKLAYRRLLELGYGEPYTGADIKPTQVKTTQIKVDSVNIVTKVNSVISTPGQALKIENIPTAQGEDIIITSPGDEARAEVLQALELIQSAGKRIYINQEGATPIRDYRYQLGAIFHKYGTLQKHQGELSDQDQDNLLAEVVILSTKLQPLDRDIYLKEFISYEPIQELGITQESLSITVDRLTSTKDKQAQEEALSKLLVETLQLQQKGDTAKALELLESKVKEVQIIGARELLSPLRSFDSLLDEIATLPPAYKTGYSSLDSFVGFTPGAITLIAGRPSHGKTTFMFNLLIQMSKIYQQETFYFFTYEEPVKNISVKLLNRLIDTDLKEHFREMTDLSKPTNYEFIKSYIRAGRRDIPQIEEGKKALGELIDSQRIKVIDRNYSVEELSSLIAYIKDKEPVGAVFIDYIQRMNTQRKTQDKRTEIAHISDKVLQIAKESGLPIILGAQLNRETTSNKGGEPRLENLKEAGNLEEDANTVLSVYCKAREEEEDTTTGAQNSKLQVVDLKIKTLKNREGEVNTSQILKWDRYTGVIKDSAQDYF